MFSLPSPSPLRPRSPAAYAARATNFPASNDSLNARGKTAAGTGGRSGVMEGAGEEGERAGGKEGSDVPAFLARF